MDKGINSTCSCHRSRCRGQKLWIQDRIGGEKFITEYRQLIISAMVCDNRKSSYLRTGSGSCRNRDQGNDFSRYFVCAFIFGDTAAKFCGHTHCLGHIHRRATTKRYDKIRFGFFESVGGLFHCCHRRVCFHICKNIHLYSCFFQIICRLVHNSHFSKCRT